MKTRVLQRLRLSATRFRLLKKKGLEGIREVLACRKGASEMVGALLLIAVVIVAASGIAVMIAQMQKNAEERQRIIESVEKENLKIMSIKLIPNQTNPEFIEVVQVTVNNLNVIDSRIATLLINDRPAVNYTSTDEYSQPKNYSFYNRLKIPAGRSREIYLNLSEGGGHFPDGLKVFASSPLKVTVFSENANIFTRTFNPPTAIIKTSIETEDLGLIQRDVLILDASESYDDGSITSYMWSTYSFNGTGYVKTGQYFGRKAVARINQTDDVYVELTLTDDDNMYTVSEKIKIPYSVSYNPPAKIATDKQTYEYLEGAGEDKTINVKAYDINNNPLKDVDVLFITTLGNVTVNPTNNVTDLYGETSTTITGGSGTLEIKAGKISRYVYVR